MGEGLYKYLGPTFSRSERFSDRRDESFTARFDSGISYEDLHETEDDDKGYSD